VPGVSSAWAAAAAAGIPLTDRRLSSSVAIVTGHEAAGKGSAVRWEALARGVDTLVILMGRAALPAIARRLQKAGRPASTPIALVRWASTPQQEILVSTLGRVEKELAARPSFEAPVVAIVGEVVKKRARHSAQPLKGKRILITRPVQDSAGLRKQLQEMGATCVHLPTIEIRPRRIPSAEAKKLIKKLPQYDWLIFTSHHGVDALARLVSSSRKRRHPRGSAVIPAKAGIGSSIKDFEDDASRRFRGRRFASISRTTLRVGFTLLELLIVISIIAILAAAIIPNFVGFDTEARVASSQTNLSTLRTRVTLFRAKEGHYPESLDELLTKSYDDMGVQRPYLEKMPSELISSKAGNSTTESRLVKEGLIGDGGWTYVRDQAKVVIDITEPLNDRWGSYKGEKPSEW